MYNIHMHVYMEISSDEFGEENPLSRKEKKYWEMRIYAGQDI